MALSIWSRDGVVTAPHSGVNPTANRFVSRATGTVPIIRASHCMRAHPSTREGQIRMRPRPNSCNMWPCGTRGIQSFDTGSVFSTLRASGAHRLHSSATTSYSLAGGVGDEPGHPTPMSVQGTPALWAASANLAELVQSPKPHAAIAWNCVPVPTSYCDTVSGSTGLQPGMNDQPTSPGGPSIMRMHCAGERQAHANVMIRWSPSGMMTRSSAAGRRGGKFIDGAATAPSESSARIVTSISPRNSTSRPVSAMAKASS